jgi:hypothetical protein
MHVIGSRGRGLGRLGERGLNSLGEGGSGGPRRTLWLGGGGADGIGGEKAALRFRGSCELLPNSLAGIVPPSDWQELEPSVGAGSR